MKNMAFTLIELLAVIVILAIILLIAVPQVLDVIEDVRINAYRSDESMMVKATETYLGSNSNLLPREIGGTTEITLNTLVNDKFIENINDTNGVCDGYVLVTKTEEGYNYNPELKCGDSNTIGSSTEDGLVAYYTFDDFQEPTENLYIGGLFPYNNLSIPYTLSVTGEFYNESPVYRLTMTPTTQAQVDSINMNLYNHGVYTFSYTYEGNTKYASSIYWKAINKNDVVVNGLASNIGGWHSGGTEEFNDGWKRCNSYRDGTVASDMTGRIFWSFSSPSFTLGETIIIDWAAPQVEKYRIYSTPYTEEERTGIVKDYSGNENHLSLDIIKTPRWTDESKLGKGSYRFDGSNCIVGEIADTNVNQLSVSLWYKGDTKDWYGALLGFGTESLNTQDIYYTGSYSSSDINSFGFNSWNTNIWGINENTFDVVDGEWHNIVANLNRLSIKDSTLYIDGESYDLAEQWNNSTIERIISTNFGIGCNGWIFTQQMAVGLIDDVKIYNRFLTAEEINFLYKLRN